MPMEIKREEVCRMVEDGAQLVEVLPREEYEAEHLPRALNIPLQQLDRQTTAPLQQAQVARRRRWRAAGRHRYVYVYCRASVVSVA